MIKTVTCIYSKLYKHIKYDINNKNDVCYLYITKFWLCTMDWWAWVIKITLILRSLWERERERVCVCVGCGLEREYRQEKQVTTLCRKYSYRGKHRCWWHWGRTGKSECRWGRVLGKAFKRSWECNWAGKNITIIQRHGGSIKPSKLAEPSSLPVFLTGLDTF